MFGIVAGLFGVNPSTADAVVDDQTITKEMGFAKVNGWSRIIKGNVFAFRSTDVGRLVTAADPVGPENDAHIARIIADADVLIPCWGDRGKLPQHLRPRLDDLLRTIMDSNKPVLHFGLTAGGDPRHPLRLSYSTELKPWTSM